MVAVLFRRLFIPVRISHFLFLISSDAFFCLFVLCVQGLGLLIDVQALEMAVLVERVAGLRKKQRRRLESLLLKLKAHKQDEF